MHTVAAEQTLVGLAAKRRTPLRLACALIVLFTSGALVGFSAPALADTSSGWTLTPAPQFGTTGAQTLTLTAPASYAHGPYTALWGMEQSCDSLGAVGAAAPTEGQRLTAGYAQLPGGQSRVVNFDASAPYLIGCYVVLNTEGINAYIGAKFSPGGLAPWATGDPFEMGPDDGEQGWRCNLSAHCIVWTTNRPAADPGFPRTWTFGVGDVGVSPLAQRFVVGWTCAHLGPTLPPNPNTPVEGFANFRYGTERHFDVQCPVGQYIWNFYVLGSEDQGTADYSLVRLFWGYGAAGSPTPTSGAPAAPDAPADCTPDLPCVIAPLPEYEPAPTWEALPVEDQATPESDTPAGGCDFGITDPSSWLCGLVGIAKKILSSVNGIARWLAGVGKLLLGLFVPDMDALTGKFDDVQLAWDGSGPGQLAGGLGTMAAPLLNLDEGAPTSCDGPTFTIPALAGVTSPLSFQPLSTCNELTQLILGYVLPLETAFIYLGGFLLGLRIVMRPFGMDTPGGPEAVTA